MKADVCINFTCESYDKESEMKSKCYHDELEGGYSHTCTCRLAWNRLKARILKEAQNMDEAIPQVFRDIFNKTKKEIG